MDLSDPHSRRLGYALIACALIVLAGWVLEVEVLSSFVPGVADTKPNATFSFALLGVPLSAREAFVTRASASLALVIASLTSAEYVLDVDLRIDELFFSDPKALGPPGRMAPLTASALVSASVSTLLPTGAHAVRLAVALGWIVALSSVTALSGHLYAVRPGDPLAITATAIPTGIALMLLAPRPRR